MRRASGVVIALLAAACGANSAPPADQPLRLTTEQPIVRGRRAPELRAPYVAFDSVTGAPVTGTFELARELGRAVIILVASRGATADPIVWQLAYQPLAPLLSDGVTFMAMIPASDSVAREVASSARLPWPFKLVADPQSAQARRLGIVAAQTRWVAVVIARDGTVTFIDREYVAGDPASTDRLVAALSAAKEHR